MSSLFPDKAEVNRVIRKLVNYEIEQFIGMCGNNPLNCHLETLCCIPLFFIIILTIPPITKPIPKTKNPGQYDNIISIDPKQEDNIPEPNPICCAVNPIAIKKNPDMKSKIPNFIDLLSPLRSSLTSLNQLISFNNLTY